MFNHFFLNAYYLDNKHRTFVFLNLEVIKEQIYTLVSLFTILNSSAELIIKAPTFKIILIIIKKKLEYLFSIWVSINDDIIWIFKLPVCKTNEVHPHLLPRDVSILKFSFAVCHLQYLPQPCSCRRLETTSTHYGICCQY